MTNTMNILAADTPQTNPLSIVLQAKLDTLKAMSDISGLLQSGQFPGFEASKITNAQACIAAFHETLLKQVQDSPEFIAALNKQNEAKNV